MKKKVLSTKTALIKAVKNPLKTLGKIWGWMRRRWLISIILLLVIGFGVHYLIKANTKEDLGLNFQAPVRQDLTKTLNISGVVDAKEKARLRFLAGGKVVYLGALQGETVARGQTIATIDQRTTQKQLEQDLNHFMKERLNWDQTNVDIFQDVYTTDEERIRERAQLDLYNQVLNVEMRNIAIQENYLTAPFAGILTASPTNVTGVQLTGADYFEVVNPESLIFRAAVDEIDLSDLSVGLTATFELDAFGGRSFETFLDYIAFTSTSTATRTVFLVDFPIDTTRYGQETFRIGMNGEVEIVVDTRENVLTIPLRATRERDGRTLVDVKTGPNTFEEREIQVGLETNRDVEVLGGLSESDQVLVP